jgi:hypothetical protein
MDYSFSVGLLLALFLIALLVVVAVFAAILCIGSLAFRIFLAIGSKLFSTHGRAPDSSSPDWLNPGGVGDPRLASLDQLPRSRLPRFPAYSHANHFLPHRYLTRLDGSPPIRKNLSK